MTTFSVELCAADLIRSMEGRMIQLRDAPITFEQFLDWSTDPDVELVNGVMVQTMSAQLEHEKLYLWLSFVTGGYVSARHLGIVLGSRTPVQINEFGGRMPDLLFVRQARMHIVQNRAVYGAPDLVIELISPNDRPSDIIALETDYRALGVPEIWFVNQQNQKIRALRDIGAGYQQEERTSGTLRSSAIEGFAIEAEWLFQDPRPEPLQTLLGLLARFLNSPI